MKPKTIPSLAALTLGLGLTGGVAMAADYDRRDRDHRDRGENTQQNDQDDAKDRDDRDRGDRHRNRRGDRGQNTQQPQQQQPQTNVEDRGDRSRDNDSNRDWGNNNDRWRQNLDNRRDNRRFGWDRYRRSLHSPHRFSIGVYHAPRGYYYRRWHHGERLPRAFYVRDYWLTNFLLFGLFAPPSDDLIWVRYGPDALLIDRYTGEIIQVRYNVFY